jgi:hypothetical protein
MLLLHPLPVPTIVRFLRHLIMTIEVTTPGGHLQALRCRGDTVILLGGEEDSSLLKLALLLLKLLLLEILDLSVNAGDGVRGGC